MYYPMPNGEYALAGFMFFVRKHGDSGPQIGGPLTIWHSHLFATNRCYEGGLWGVGFANDGVCEIGEGHARSAEMMHVWLIDHPRGPFATGMMLPPGVVAEKVALRKRERGF